jgi:hypothetical protein
MWRSPIPKWLGKLERKLVEAPSDMGLMGVMMPILASTDHWFEMGLSHQLACDAEY